MLHTGPLKMTRMVFGLKYCAFEYVTYTQSCPCVEYIYGMWKLLGLFMEIINSQSVLFCFHRKYTLLSKQISQTAAPVHWWHTWMVSKMKTLRLCTPVPAIQITPHFNSKNIMFLLFMPLAYKWQGCSSVFIISSTIIKALLAEIKTENMLLD